MKKKIKKHLIRFAYLFILGFPVFLLSAFFLVCEMDLYDIPQEIFFGKFRYAIFDLVFLVIIFVLVLFLIGRFIFGKLTKRILAASEKIAMGEFDVDIKIPTMLSNTHLAQVAEYIMKMAKMLSKMEVLRNDFIASVSHELKTPLAIINSYVSLLKDPNLKEEDKKIYLSEISETCNSFSYLISNILKINKLENQDYVLNKSLFNLSENIIQCILNFADSMEKNKIVLKTEIPDGVMYESDSQLLSIAWNNLISNAIKFSKNNGKIAVKLKEESDCILVSVEDNGCGISQESLSKIFDKFYQGDTSHKTEGNGLGLSLVKKIINIVDGEIFVDSREGVGSTFTIKLKK